MRNRAAYRILFTPNSPATHATRNSIHDFKRNTVILSITDRVFIRDGTNAFDLWKDSIGPS